MTPVLTLAGGVPPAVAMGGSLLLLHRMRGAGHREALAAA